MGSCRQTDEDRNKDRKESRGAITVLTKKGGRLKNGKTVGQGEMKAVQETERDGKRESLVCGGGKRGAWVSNRERSCTALMKKAVQLDGEPSVSASPGGFIITLHS